jgi:hypothetical protein
MNAIVNTENKKAKERSPSFPFISLEYAIERAKQFYAEEKRGSAFMTIAAGHWGYSAASSGLQQTVAALKSYGLLQDEGNSAQRKLRLTETALRIILDERPESSEREQFIRQAALTPSMAMEVLKEWPDELPSSATLNHWLILEKKFSQETAMKVAKILKQNQAFAKVYAIKDGPSGDKIESDNGSDAEFDVQVSNEKVVGELSRGVSRPGKTIWAESPMPQSPSGTQVGSIPVTKNCTISIMADGPVTGEGLDRLIAYINLIRSSFPEKDEESTQ